MEQLTKNQAVATSQEAVQNQNEPQLRDENAHNDKSVHGVLNPTYQAGLRRDAVQPDIEAERKKRDEIEAGKSYCSRRFGGATCDDKSAQIYARFDKNDWRIQPAEFYRFHDAKSNTFRIFRRSEKLFLIKKELFMLVYDLIQVGLLAENEKFALSLRSSRSSYFATFRHQLTILSKTDALDEEKWLNMLGTFVKDWFRYESHFVHGRDSLVDILKERGLLSESDAVQPLIGKKS